MNEAQVRQRIVDIMRGWVGLKESDGSFKVILDTYNSLKPLPRPRVFVRPDDCPV